MRKHREHAGVQEMGCAALTNLAAKNDDSRDEIGKQVL
jgi:type IV pilus biogenesis protein CpaD/CtpE